MTVPTAMILGTVALLAVGYDAGGGPGRSLTIDGRTIGAAAVTVTRTGLGTYRVVIDEPRLRLDFTIDLTEHLFDRRGNGPDPANGVGRPLEGGETSRSLAWTRALVDGKPVVSTAACYPPDSHMFGSLSRLDGRIDGRFTLVALANEDYARGCGRRDVQFSFSAPIDSLHR